jgi:hypothetical protein
MTMFYWLFMIYIMESEFPDGDYMDFIIDL